MRKIIVYNVISLDGYHTGLGNDVSVMFPMMGKVFDSYNAELLRTADVHLMGRVSFELFQSFWPKVAENPTSDEWTDSQRDLSQAGKSVKGIVVSDTLTGKLAGCPHHQASRRLSAACRTQTPGGQRYFDHRQQDPLERSAGT